MTLLLEMLLKEVIITLSVVVYGGVKSEECLGKPADILFVLDSSSSIEHKDFKKEVNFTQEVVKTFDIGTNKTQVGLVLYSTTVVPEFYIGQLTSKDEILQKIKNIEFLGGNTNTAEALNYIYQKAFSSNQPSADKSRIAIIFTDGQSNDVAKTMAEASIAKSKGITLFVIGIGDQVDNTELEAMASKPLTTHLLSVENFDALAKVKDKLATRVCKAQPATPAPPTEPMMNDDDVLYGEGVCYPKKPVSLVFGVDTSSVGAENAYFVMLLVNRISSRLQMDKQQISLSIVTSGCGHQAARNTLVDHVHDQTALQNRLNKFTLNTFQSLFQNMRRKIQLDKNRKIAFIFLSRQLGKDEYHKSELEARRAKFKKIETFVIGIGSRFNEAQAVGLTVKKHHYLHSYSYDTLYELEGPILYRICKV